MTVGSGNDLMARIDSNNSNATDEDSESETHSLFGLFFHTVTTGRSGLKQNTTKTRPIFGGDEDKADGYTRFGMENSAYKSKVDTLILESKKNKVIYEQIMAEHFVTTIANHLGTEIIQILYTSLAVLLACCVIESLMILFIAVTVTTILKFRYHL